MRVVDLSHPISNKMTTYPSDPDVSILREKEIHSEGSLLHRFTMGTHTGTHLDAPAHIISGGKTLDDFAISSFTGQTIKVDLNLISALDKVDEKIDGIIYDTGWYKNFNDPKIYFGSDRPEIPKTIVKKSIEMGGSRVGVSTYLAQLDPISFIDVLRQYQGVG